MYELIQLQHGERDEREQEIVETRDVLVLLNFWKILVSARFCGMCLVVFHALTMKFLRRLNFQFLHVQVKNVNILGKQTHPRKPYYMILTTLKKCCANVVKQEC